MIRYLKLKLKLIVPATIVAGLFFLVCLNFQTHGISGGDSGDMVTAAATFGVPHPPGYPLYTYLGFILNHLPFGTPAYRVAFLSSITHALVIFLLFLFILHLTKKYLAAIYASLVLASTYLFFFYSVTPEVFALLDLFIILILWMLYKFYLTQKRVYIFALSFIFGLAMTHHHLIVVLGFPLFITYFLRRKELKFVRDHLKLKTVFFCLLFFFLGLTSYFYAYVAGLNNSLINWNKPNNLENLIRLITRSDYGTFQSGNMYGTLPSQRMVNVKLFFKFLSLDFHFIQLILMIIGACFIFVKKRTVGIFLISSWFFYGPLFFFYASFPVVNRFMIGTYERFLLPSYLVSSIFLGLGFYLLINIFPKILNNFSTKKYFKTFTFLLMIVVLMLPLVIQMRTTLFKMRGMAQDRTADNLGRDILNTLKPNSILLLVNDTPLFITQYVRYALNYRPDTKVFHAPSLSRDSYLTNVKAAVPELAYPQKTSDDMVGEFMNLNKAKFPIYSNIKIDTPEGYFWMPRGILYELVAAENLPTVAEFASQSAELLQTYQKPLDGILSNYPHLMLHDILNIYAYAYQNTGKILMQGGLMPEALNYFNKSIELQGDMTSFNAYLNAGYAQMLMGNCGDSLVSLQAAEKYADDENRSELIELTGSLYKECFKDQKKAEDYLNQHKKQHIEQKNDLKQWR